MQSSLLFQENDPFKNWLPYEGTVHYMGKIIPPELANDYFQDLLDNILWKQDEAIIYGKKILTTRKVAWYGDLPYEYTYSKTTKKAMPWTNTLLKIKKIVEKEAQETFNSCLLNLYHSGQEGMAWHSDAEKDLKKNGTIASLSLGAERKFAFKHKQTNEKIELLLEHGSLLLMKNETQHHWLHRLPPTKKITAARINLTFRTISNSAAHSGF